MTAVGPVCQNGGCASTRVALYRIEGLPEPRYLCRDCRWALRSLYVMEPTAPDARRLPRVAPRMRRAG